MGLDAPAWASSLRSAWHAIEFSTYSNIDDELDLSADNLRNLDAEQSGGIGHERMIEWMLRNYLTQERAADATGEQHRET